MQQLQVGACVVERVFASDYKAATLSVDEVVLPAGQKLAWRTFRGDPRADEVLVFVRTEAGASVAHAGQASAVRGDAAFCVAMTGEPDVSIAAEAARPTSCSPTPARRERPTSRLCRREADHRDTDAIGQRELRAELLEVLRQVTEPHAPRVVRERHRMHHAADGRLVVGFVQRDGRR
jgi:hypothetical protein